MIITKPERVLFDVIATATKLQWRDGMRLIGKVSDNKVVGVLAFETYTGHSIWLHMWLARPYLFPDLATAGYDYVFNQLKCKNLFVQVKDSDKRAMRMFNKLGFLEVTRIPQIYSENCGLVILKADTTTLFEGHYGRIHVDS